MQNTNSKNKHRTVPCLHFDSTYKKTVNKTANFVIENLIDSVKNGKNIIIKNITKNALVECECELSERAKKIVLAGGLLSYTKEQM